MPPPEPFDAYAASVKYARRVIPERGRIWEGCRPAFEAGEYHDEVLARMLREGVIVPATDNEGGYVLPKKGGPFSPTTKFSPTTERV